MTPKEKANELGNKFYQGSVFDYDKQGHLDEIKRAKERVLICVGEMLNFAYNIEWEKKEEAISRVKFLKEVKQEIIKL